MSTPRDDDRGSDDDTAREQEQEPTTEPATSGHSTADTQVERNREDESPG